MYFEGYKRFRKHVHMELQHRVKQKSIWDIPESILPFLIMRKIPQKFQNTISFS